MSGTNNHGGEKPGYGYGDGNRRSKINLIVKDQYGTEVFFTLRRSTKLKKLMDAYCDHRQFVVGNSTSVLFDATSFLFGERSIQGEQTPYELQMEEGDKIHAILHLSEEHKAQYHQQLAIILSLEEELSRLCNDLEEYAGVDAPKSSKEMSILNMFAEASTDAIEHQSRPLAKGPTHVDDAAFLYRPGYKYKSILRTPVSRKEGGFPPPVGGTEAAARDVGTSNPIDKRSKRKKSVSFQDGPFKRTRDVSGDSYRHGDGDSTGDDKLVSSLVVRNNDHGDGHSTGDNKLVSSWVRNNDHGDGQSTDDDKLVSSRVVHNNDNCSSGLLVCRERVRGFFSPAKKLDVVRVGAKDAIVKIYQQFARMGSLLPNVMNKVQSLRGQSEGFQRKFSTLQGRVNAEHIVDIVMEKEVTEKPVEGGPTSMGKVVSVEQSVEKDGEKVFQGGEALVCPLSNVLIGGGGGDEGAIKSCLGGGDGNPVDPTNLFRDAGTGKGGDALP